MEIAAKNVLADFLTILADVASPPNTDDPSALKNKEDEATPAKSDSFDPQSYTKLKEIGESLLDNPSILNPTLREIARLLREHSKFQEDQLGYVFLSDMLDTGRTLPLQDTSDFLRKRIAWERLQPLEADQ
jgi:hypothetical protein